MGFGCSLEHRCRSRASCTRCTKTAPESLLKPSTNAVYATASPSGTIRTGRERFENGSGMANCTVLGGSGMPPAS